MSPRPEAPELETVDEPILRKVNLRPIQWDAITPAHIAIAYDRPSDTLLIHLFGRGRPAVSVPVDRYLYALVDLESERTVGLHIEGFLAQAVKEHPELIAILDHAELRGITPIEVRTLQRELLGSWSPLPERRDVVVAPQEVRDKVGAIMRLLAVVGADWMVSGRPAA